MKKIIVISLLVVLISIGIIILGLRLNTDVELKLVEIHGGVSTREECVEVSASFEKAIKEKLGIELTVDNIAPYIGIDGRLLWYTIYFLDNDYDVKCIKYDPENMDLAPPGKETVNYLGHFDIIFSDDRIFRFGDSPNWEYKWRLNRLNDFL